MILLDILMPEMDGYETCRRLKSDDETKDIPVLFMSALTEVFDKVKAFNLGAVDYVTKPINVEELLVRVHTQVKLSKMQKS
ncbi:MAG: response regulator [Chloroflexia bacterium]|nr:response regulator [Chloroflexia bacterium]